MKRSVMSPAAIAAMLTVLLCSGCSEKVPAAYIYNAIDTCKNKGGIVSVVVNSSRLPQYVITEVVCGDMSITYLDARKGT